MTRIDSSNFNPLIGWGCGAQLVALNFQAKDESMLINYGLFRKNGGIHSGWVLKPNVLKGMKRSTDAKTRFKMTIISAQNLGALLPKENAILESYVYIEITMIDILKSEEHGTHIIAKNLSSVSQYNLFHPIWRDSEINMTAEFAETAIIIFKVASFYN